jgi:hypothetical protein
VLLYIARLPIAILHVPPVLKRRELYPMAILVDAAILQHKAFRPNDMLLDPDVFDLKE